MTTSAQPGHGVALRNLVRALRERRIRLWSQDGALRYRAPQGALTPDLRAQLVEHKQALLEIVPAAEPIAEPVPSSFAQEAMWFLNRAMPENPAFNVAFSARVRSAVDLDAFRRAAQDLIDRHSTLRTLFDDDDGAPAASVYPTLPVVVRQVDASGLDDSALHALVKDAYSAPFDLARGPLIRFDWFSLDPKHHVLLIAVHHIAVDGWSLWLALDELRVLYEAYAQGRVPSLPPLGSEYTEYTQWQGTMVRGDEGAAHAAYWRENLAGSPAALELPTDHARVPGRQPRGASHHVALAPELTTRIKDFARQEGVTPFVVLLAGYALLLSRHSGEQDLIIGTPTSGRTQPSFEGLLGCFVNPVPLRIRCIEGSTVRSLLEQARRIASDALAHQDYPYRLISEAAAASRSGGRPQLFQVDFAFQKAQRFAQVVDSIAGPGGDQEVVNFGGMNIQFYDLPQQEGQLDLTLELIESRGAFVGSFKYDANLFEPMTIARMEGHLGTILGHLVRDAGQSIDRIPVLTPAEERQIIHEWNATTHPIPDVTAHVLIERHAVSRPNVEAIVMPSVGGRGRERLTYGELNARANQLARHLMHAGAGPERSVALYLEPSLDLFVAILAVLKSGAAYVPLDVAQPTKRITDILDDAKPVAILARSTLPLDASEYAKQIAFVDRIGETLATYSTENPDVLVRPENLAYVIFTSGSTGKPKGVAIEHRSWVNAYVGWEIGYDLLDIAAHLQMANVAFDVFAGDFIRALGSGATLVICPRELLLAPDVMFSLFESERIECAEFVPAVLRELMNFLEREGRRLDHMKLLACGSDVWYGKEYERFRRSCGARTRLVNSYGITETTIDSSFFEGTVRGDSDQLVPIGRPFANVRLYVLDAFKQPVPIGVVGELYVAGAGVGRGYLDRPELTAERFLEDPFVRAEHGPARMYRSGDRARFLPDGNVEFLGRADTQVKVRGFRVELGEIESAIGEFPGIRSSVVLAKPGRDGHAQLAAFVTTIDGSAVAPIDVQRFVRERVPDYMVPSAVHWMAELPLTPNGKVDRRALLQIEIDPAQSLEERVPPEGETETALAAIWSDLLGAQDVSRHDSFFQLGGHSLLATRLMTRVRHRFDVELPVRTLFEAPVLADLAERIALAQWAILGAESAIAGLDDSREEFTL